MMKIRLIALLLIGSSIVNFANAGLVNAIGEFLGKATGKAARVVDDVPIPKHAPDVAPIPKPSFDPIPSSEVNSNASVQVARVVAKCKEQGMTSDWQRQCEQKGEKMKICITSETHSGSSKEQAIKNCDSLTKNNR